MATVEDLKAWYARDLSRYASWADAVEIVPTLSNESNEVTYLRFRIYTDIHVFLITAREPKALYRETEPPNAQPSAEFPAPGAQIMPRPARMDEGYLGCIASSRKPRAGEGWTRGNDLADGPLTEETWHRILADIVSYELVRVHKPKEPLADGVFASQGAIQ